MKWRLSETFQGVMRFCLRYKNQWTSFFRTRVKQLQHARMYVPFLSRSQRTNKRIVRRPMMAPVTFDMKRRAFVRYTLFGGAVFLVGKYLSPAIDMFRGDTVIDEKVFNNFKITETGKQLRVTDDSGEELLTIDKE